MVYDFPLASLRNSSIKSLLLSRWNLTLPATVMSTQFEAMKSLFLEQVYLTDEMISNLITGCANLEYLVIMHCYGMKDIRISSLNLKNLGLWKFHCDEGSLEISAPNLSKIGFYFFEVGRYVLEVTSALVEADICFVHKAVNYGYCCKAMRFLGNVECLSIQNWGYKNFEDLVSEDFSKIYFSLPSLKKLKFNCYWGVKEDLCPQGLLDGVEVPRVVLLKEGERFHGSFPDVEILYT